MSRSHDGVVVVVLFALALAATRMWLPDSHRCDDGELAAPADVEEVVFVRRVDHETQRETWIRMPEGWRRISPAPGRSRP